MYVYLCSVCASISEDEAQEALLGVISEPLSPRPTQPSIPAGLLGAISDRCCYGKSAVNEMDIYQIISTSALHVSGRDSSSVCLSVCLVITAFHSLVYV